MIEKSCGPVPFWMIDRFDSKMNPYFSTSKTYLYKNLGILRKITLITHGPNARIVMIVSQEFKK